MFQGNKKVLEVFQDFKNPVVLHKQHQKSLTLFFVIAPTMSGQTMPESVPTPLEIPMRMLA